MERQLRSGRTAYGEVRTERETCAQLHDTIQCFGHDYAYFRCSNISKTKMENKKINVV